MFLPVSVSPFEIYVFYHFYHFTIVELCHCPFTHFSPPKDYEPPRIKSFLLPQKLAQGLVYACLMCKCINRTLVTQRTSILTGFGFLCLLHTAVPSHPSAHRPHRSLSHGFCSLTVLPLTWLQLACSVSIPFCSPSSPDHSALALTSNCLIPRGFLRAHCKSLTSLYVDRLLLIISVSPVQSAELCM